MKAKNKTQDTKPKTPVWYLASVVCGLLIIVGCDPAPNNREVLIIQGWLGYHNNAYPPSLDLATGWKEGDENIICRAYFEYIIEATNAFGDGVPGIRLVPIDSNFYCPVAGREAIGFSYYIIDERTNAEGWSRTYGGWGDPSPDCEGKLPADWTEQFWVEVGVKKSEGNLTTVLCGLADRGYNWPLFKTKREKCLYEYSYSWIQDGEGDGDVNLPLPEGDVPILLTCFPEPEPRPPIPSPCELSDGRESFWLVKYDSNGHYLADCNSITIMPPDINNIAQQEAMFPVGWFAVAERQYKGCSGQIHIATLYSHREDGTICDIQPINVHVCDVVDGDVYLASDFICATEDVNSTGQLAGFTRIYMEDGGYLKIGFKDFDGDINGDGKVDYKDFAFMAAAWGTNIYDIRYNAAADADKDTTIGIPSSRVTDLRILKGKWLK